MFVLIIIEESNFRVIEKSRLQANDLILISPRQGVRDSKHGEQ